MHTKCHAVMKELGELFLCLLVVFSSIGLCISSLATRFPFMKPCAKGHGCHMMGGYVTARTQVHGGKERLITSKVASVQFEGCFEHVHMEHRNCQLYLGA